MVKNPCPWPIVKTIIHGEIDLWGVTFYAHTFIVNRALPISLSVFRREANSMIVVDKNISASGASPLYESY